MSDHQQAIEAAIAASASKVMYSGAGAAGAGIVLSNTVIGLLGLLIALAGFCVNSYYRRKQDRRDEREHQMRIDRMTERGPR